MFRNYAGGIFEDETCPQTKSNHAIIGVGYDKIEGNFLKKNISYNFLFFTIQAKY